MPDHPGRIYQFHDDPRAVNPRIYRAAIRLLDDLLNRGDPSDMEATLARANSESNEVLHTAIRLLAEYSENPPHL
jgi:uncharacterized protein YaeQ